MKKLVIVIACLVIATGSLVALASTAHVTINNIEISVFDIEDYKSIVESSFDELAIITDGTDEMNACFDYTLSEEYTFSIKDVYKSIDIPRTILYDRDRFRDILNNWNESLSESKDAYVDFDKEVVVNEIYGDRVNTDAILLATDSAVNNSRTVTLADYRIKPAITSDMLQEHLQQYLDIKGWRVSYYGMDNVLIVPDECIEITDDDILVTDTEFIDTYLKEVSSAFSTVGKEHSFKTHDGDLVTVKGGTLGNKVDTEKEKEILLEMLSKNKSQENRVPIYSKVLSNLDTYIEVSLTEQHVWFYQNGGVVMESDCVSGTKDTKRATPTGFWYMDIVTPGKMLHPSGEESGTWVDRWMRFTPDGCGLHDAGWRGKFGGNIYTYNGSHGCVNLPKNFAFELYEYAYVGMPVIVY